MRVVYIAHALAAPTRAEMDENRARAARWCAWAARRGVAPVATWIVLSGELSETQENRELGLTVDCATVERCDEIWLVGGRVSSGMKRESEHAALHGVIVIDLTHLGEEPPDKTLEELGVTFADYADDEADDEVTELDRRRLGH
jgi:hypothetical protein